MVHNRIISFSFLTNGLAAGYNLPNSNLFWIDNKPVIMVSRNLPPLLRASSHLDVADTVVKVPEMAESITEGTLKQFSKRE